MRVRGTCASCGQDRWLGGRKVCKGCRYTGGSCRQCGHVARVIVDRLCYCCYQHRQVDGYLADLERRFQPMSPYNRQLFELYLSYIRRYRLQYFHKRQAQRLMGILERDAWEMARTWHDIYRLASRYKLDHDNGKGNGSAVKKIGFMLQELGVLAAKDDDLHHLVQQALTGLRPAIRDEATRFAAWLEQSGRTESTTVNNLQHLKQFDRWLGAVRPELDFAAVAEAQLVEYLDHLRSRGYKPSRIRDGLLTIRRYYRWLRLKRRVLHNPAAKIEPAGTRLKRLVVLPPSDTRAVIRFVKNPASDPEQALMLALILFFGLKTEDLMHATVDVQDGVLAIALRRRRRSRGRHHYHRDQVLKLPRAPTWMAELQARYLVYWRKQYGLTKATFPAAHLILRRDGQSPRPLTERVIVDRVYAATEAAIGRRVPPKVLRQTCGDLHVRDGDGSLLSTLGWSPQFAFHYTWLPRHLYRGT